MHRTHRELAVAKLVQQLANTALVQLDAERACDTLLEIDTPEPHHAVFSQGGALLYPARNAALLNPAQASRAATACPIGKPLQPRLVVAVHPVAQGLPVHAAGSRSVLAARPVQYQRNSQGTGFGSRVGSEPAQEPERPPTARIGEKPPRTVPQAVPAVPPPLPTGLTPEGLVRASAGVFGAGAVPATRIGQRNAAIRGQNQARAAARRMLEGARTVLERLERAAVAGVRRVMGLARGVGVQAVAERDARAEAALREQAARAQAWATQLAEMKRTSAARLAAEQARIAAERRQREEAAQRQADQVRAKSRDIWREVEDVGRKAEQADRARLRLSPEQERERSRLRQGPGFGR